jgi:hypothetical protein
LSGLVVHGFYGPGLKINTKEGEVRTSEGAHWLVVEG